MYCEKCKCEVPTKREDIDWFLLVILAIFTAGFGVLIYLAIYFDKPENRCIHCNSVCIPSKEYKPYESSFSDNTAASNIYPVKQAVTSTLEQEQTEVLMGKYCPSCGAKLEENSKANFCAYCGFDIS